MFIKLTRYQRAGAKAIDAALRERSDEPTVAMYRLSHIADEAAFAAGKKNDLFPSIYSYADLLPQGASTGWFDGFWCALNPYSAQPLPQSTLVMAGPFDAAVDMGPGQPPMLPDRPLPPTGD